MNYSREWAIRCAHEASLYPFNYFVTLTYSDDFIPTGTFLKDNRTGEVSFSSLNKSDPVNFMKRLRQNLKRDFNFEGCRAFYCGEYGDLTDRPHYHFLLFNMPDLASKGDLTFFKREGSFDIFSSDLIDRSWCFNPSRKRDSGISLGFATIQDFSFDTAAYCARYVLKKLKGEAVRFSLDNVDSDLSPRVQPFCNMSRRPGIGSDYFNAHPEISETDTVYYQKNFETFASRPPRYYDKLFDVACGGEYHHWTEIRRNGKLDHVIDSSESYQIDVFDMLDSHGFSKKQRSCVVHSSEHVAKSAARSLVSSERFASDLERFTDLEARARVESDLNALKEKKMHHAL